MARGFKQKAEPQATVPTPKKNVNSAEMWIKESWHGWMKSLSWLVLLAVGYIAYSQHWVNERMGGVALVAAIVGGSIALAAVPAFSLLANWKQKALLLVFVLVWAFTTGYPSLSVTWPKTALKQVNLGDTAAHLSDTVNLADALRPGEKGPYELAVGGTLKGSGEGEANYRITINGEGSSVDEVTGAIKRTIVRQRTSRRGGTSAVRQEHMENLHRLPNVSGTQLRLTMDSVDEQLEHGVHVYVQRASLNTTWMLIVAALCILIGLFLDYRLAEPKVKTYFTMATALTAVFAYHFPIEATPHFLVPPAISSGFIALFVGGLGGSLLAFIARNLKPKPKLRK